VGRLDFSSEANNYTVTISSVRIKNYQAFIKIFFYLKYIKIFLKNLFSRQQKYFKKI
jgi:hypothetical protein